MREARTSSGGGGGREDVRPDASPTGSSSSSSTLGGRGATGIVASGDGTPNSSSGNGAVQFIPIRSRVGKRFQAAIPELLDADARAKKQKTPLAHVAKPQFVPERAKGAFVGLFCCRRDWLASHIV